MPGMSNRSRIVFSYSARVSRRTPVRASPFEPRLLRRDERLARATS